MNPLLRNFYTNESMREAFKAFQLDIMKQLALEAVFASKDVKGFPEAEKIVEKTFDKLHEIYGKIQKEEISNSR